MHAGFSVQFFVACHYKVLQAGCTGVILARLVPKQSNSFCMTFLIHQGITRTKLDYKPLFQSKADH